MFLPQTSGGAVEDIRVYIVVGGILRPGGEWHQHMLGQSR